MTTSPLDLVRRQATLTTHHIYSLPVVVLMPHSRCNCRCVMCDIWKANHDRREISRDDLAQHVESLRHLNVRRVVLSGGEALMHSNLWVLCDVLRDVDVKITLLSTGLLLERHSADVVHWCDDVIVSIDGPPAIHDAIRNIPRAFDRLTAGVASLKRLVPPFRVTGRCVVQRRNFRALPRIVDSSRALGLDQISFLAADVSTEAFNRPNGWDRDRTSDIGLALDEAEELGRIVEAMVATHASDFATGFIAEDPPKLRRIVDYFAALNGAGDFPETVCNAPWVSTVIEPDGTVRPCFFHRALGNIHDQPLESILNSPEAVDFRRTLDVKRDSICRKCVCTLHLGRRATV